MTNESAMDMVYRNEVPAGPGRHRSPTERAWSPNRFDDMILTVRSDLVAILTAIRARRAEHADDLCATLLDHVDNWLAEH